MNKWLTFGLFLLAAILIGCNQPEATTEPSTAAPDGSAAVPPGDTRVIPTLYPTSSPMPTASATVPVTRPPTAVPDTPVAFDEPVVELSYRIPALDLDRQLTGNLASQIEAVDLTTGQTATRQNQAGILLELQQALSELDLTELPEGCDFCVQLSYALPLSDISAEGWLEDMQFLASVENYMAALLGPHFPPETEAGLRRSATPFYPAHTVAQTTENLMWRWLAVDAELAGPGPADLLAPNLAAFLAQVDVTSLRDTYQAPCPDGSGIESLYLANADGDRNIRLVCPELALPAGLVPVYVTLKALADETVANVQEEPVPDPAMPLESLLLYRTADGRELNLFIDGRAVLVDEPGQVLSTTVNVSQILTITSTLADSGLLRPGVEGFVLGEADNYLVVRGPDGVDETIWNDEPVPGLQPFLDLLEDLIDRMLGEDDGPTPTAAADETPSADETPPPDETPDATPEAPPSPETTESPSPAPTGTPEP